ncbi:hypothetical protein Gohar_025635 [Gossypium harknessii]|uniref:Uncharacterized protein n=1 Tax=Gossypium harknessii TaxID=34285 RepID=A0A7J9IEF5_9ROSI|nr:hypothetical protein [Gossypium harknessii]
MGKASGDRHLIEKWVSPTSTALAGTIVLLKFIRRKGDGRFLGYVQSFYVFVPSTKLIEEFLESEWPPN